MLFTLAHELTHHIRKWSPAKFKILADFLVEEYGRQGVNVDGLVREQINKAKRSDRTISYDTAYEEMVADSMEMMLSDGNVIKKLAKLKARDQGLWQKIKDFINELATKIRNVYKGLKPDSVEGRYVADMGKVVYRLQELFAEALVDASENYQSAEVEKNTTEGGEVKYQIREIGNTGKFYVQADRQVLTGDDASLWGKQIENYINEQIRKEQDVAIPTSDGHVLLLTSRSAYKLKDNHVASIQKKVEAVLADDTYALKGRVATHIDELIQVARFKGYEPDWNNKHGNDVGEDGFNYFEAFFRDFDGRYYLVPFSAGLNAQEETVYSIGWIRQRSFPADTGSSSNQEALKNGRKASGGIIYSSEAKSQEVKTALQLAYERALNKKTGTKSLTPGEEGVVTNRSGDPVAYSTEDGSVLLSMRTYEEDGREALRNYLQKCVESEKLTQAEMQEMLDGIEEIYGVCKEFKDKYAPFSAWSDAAVVRDTHGRPVFSVVTPNGDYKMNLDFSLVCKKRRTLDAVFNEMSRRGIIDDFELGQKSVVRINEIIRKYGLETACALCFVDAKRFRQASMADRFTRLYNELVESLVPEAQKGSIDHFNFSGYATIKKVEGGIDTWDDSKLDFSHLDHVLKTYGEGTVEYKAAKYIKTHPEGRKLLLRGDFMSSQGFDAVKTQNRDILKLYNSKKGTGGPKAAFGDVQYMNEIIKKARTWTPKKAYEVGGIRIQSFSDYVPRMVFDYVQMIYDLAATKLPAHAYTKEALFVKQFGLTGVKINMSLIPAIAEGGIAPGLDANGNYVWAGESFDFETAKQIQNAPGYTENCGTICVGVSYQHIIKLLSDPDIRMVIPYHKSGLNPIVAHMNKIAEFTDYTSLKTNPGGCQSTIDKNGSKVEMDFNFNEVLRKTGDPRETVRQYLSWCAKNEYTPRFAEFAWHENYYKLIEDFTLFDKDGNYVPQREVRAVFPKETDAFGSMKDLIREGLEEDAVVEGKRDANLSAIVDEIQRTLPRTEAEIAEEQVEQADRDLEAEAKYSVKDFDSSKEKIEQNTIDLAKLSPVHAVPVSKLERTGKRPTDIFAEYFDGWDNNIHSDELGDIALRKSSIKSEIRHGITAEKIASIEAIPSVIKKGKIIFADRKPGSDVWRIVVCAPITIGKNSYYMGIMLQRDTQNQRLYLHNVAIEKEVSDISQADLLTTGADESNEHLFITNILQKALAVKYKIQYGQIQWSDRDSDSVSNRSLLANALEGVAQTDWEKQKLTEYKSQIQQIEAQEKKLRELNQQIRELSFAQGPRDKAKLSALRDEATKTVPCLGGSFLIKRWGAIGPLPAAIRRTAAVKWIRTSSAITKKNLTHTDEVLILGGVRGI